MSKLWQSITGGGSAAPAAGAPAQKAAPKKDNPASDTAPTQENAKKQVEAAGWKYEPGIYEYRVNPQTGRLQRRLKGGKK